MTKKFNPEHAVKHDYTRANSDDVDAPDLTDNELANPEIFEDVFPLLAGKFNNEIKKCKTHPCRSP